MGFSTFTMLKGALLLLVASVIISSGQEEVSTDGQQVAVTVDVTQILHITEPSYLSITISGGQLRKGLIGYEFGPNGSKRLHNLAAALGPADVRIGGTYGDFLIFDPTSDDSNCIDVDEAVEDIADSDSLGGETTNTSQSDKQQSFNAGSLDFVMSGKKWDNLTIFCDGARWNILWDFNLLTTSEGPWDPTAAKEFLRYSASRGVRLPMFELGNEPNLYRRKFNLDIGAELLVQDYVTLRDVIAEMPQYSASGLYAPGVNNLDIFKSPRAYLAQFLEAENGCNVIAEISLHHYYFKAEEAHLSDFTDLDVMETLGTELEFAYNISRAHCRLRKPIRFTETSTASGGGVKSVSNAYIAGFLWLDKLGMSATYGITRVFRQTFMKSSYALVTQKLKPNPDYYLSVLYKRLVEGPVFQVESPAPTVRVYAHCVGKSHYSYPDGAVVFYYLNIANESSVLSLGQFQGSDVDLFILTPGDELGMLSRKTKLNGQLLEMTGDDLPALDPEHHSGDVPLAGLTFGFIVVPGADVQHCKNYHRHDDGVPVSC